MMQTLPPMMQVPPQHAATAPNQHPTFSRNHSVGTRSGVFYDYNCKQWSRSAVPNMLASALNIDLLRTQWEAQYRCTRRYQ